MSRRFSTFWQAIARPVRAEVRDAADVAHDRVASAATSDATHADRLERIAVYARAGFFDVNHGVELYPSQVEIGPY